MLVGNGQNRPKGQAWMRGGKHGRTENFPGGCRPSVKFRPVPGGNALLLEYFALRTLGPYKARGNKPQYKQNSAYPFHTVIIGIFAIEFNLWIFMKLFRTNRKAVCSAPRLEFRTRFLIRQDGTAMLIMNRKTEILMV
jgi:hypothetical protein